MVAPTRGARDGGQGWSDDVGQRRPVVEAAAAAVRAAAQGGSPVVPPRPAAADALPESPLRSGLCNAVVDKGR